MEEKDYPKWIAKYHSFLQKWRVATVLRKVMPTLIVDYSPNIQLRLDDSGSSYTDGKSINLSLNHSFFDNCYSEADWLLVMRGLEAHECQHVNSTPIHFMKDIRDWYGDYLHDKHGINKAIGAKIGGTFFNIFEDGRIEQIAATHHPGLKVPLQFLNVEMFKDSKLSMDDLDGGQKEYMALQNLTLCYSKLGLSIPGYNDLAGTEFDKRFQSIYPYLDKAVNGLTCQDCYDATQKALAILAPYIAKLLKASSDLMDMLEKLADSMSGSDGSESELNDGDPSDGIRMNADMLSIGQKGSGSGGDGEGEEDGEDTKSGSGKGKGKSKDASDDKADGKGAGEGEEDKEDKDSDGKDGKDSKDSADKNGQKASRNPAGADSANDDLPPSGQCMDGETTSGPKATKESGNARSKIPELDATKLPYSEQELANAIEESAAGCAPAAQPKSKEVPRNELSDKEKEELEREYAGDEYRRFREHFTDATPMTLPSETMAKASILHRRLLRILQQRRQEQRNQRKGILDVRALWKAGCGERGIMMKRGKPVTADCAVFELVDNSGSMAGEKFKLARLTAGALEIALHGLASLKISLFNTSYSGGYCCHETVKDFDKVGPSDKSVAFGSITIPEIVADGGNKDGYSIRVATRELLKRQEKNKVLVVISDGEPTDYAGGTTQGKKDVRDAVAEAKKKGIIVIALLIGDRYYIQSHRSRHAEMYGRNLIACEPTEMLAEFEKLFTRLIKES